MTAALRASQHPASSKPQGVRQGKRMTREEGPRVAHGVRMSAIERPHSIVEASKIRSQRITSMEETPWRKGHRGAHVVPLRYDVSACGTGVGTCPTRSKWDITDGWMLGTRKMEDVGREELHKWLA